MSHAGHRSVELKDPGYELFIGAVSLLSIVNVVLLYVVEDLSLDTVLLVMNALISVILFADFVYRLVTAPSRSEYLFRHYGWAELRNRAGSALLSLLLLGILVLQFGSLWVLALEQDAPDATITSAPDALWYVLVTISTVGYGDEYPVTTGGRALGSIVILIGVGIFGTFTGYLANRFLAPKAPLVEDADSTRARIEQLRVLMAQQQAAIDELDAILRHRRRDP